MVLFVDISDVGCAVVAAAYWEQRCETPVQHAGICAIDGSAVHEMMRLAALRAGLQVAGYTAQSVKEQQLAQADGIYAMTASACRSLKQDYPQFVQKIRMFPASGDPFGMGAQAYDKCVHDIMRGVEVLL